MSGYPDRVRALIFFGARDVERDMQTTIQDLRYAVRSILRARGFAAVAILTIALGIGANTAMFTVVHAVLLRPLPYAHPERLVMVWQDLRARGGPADEWATPGNYADWRREAGLFQQIAVISGWRPTLTGDAEPEPVTGEQVSHEYFSVLGIRPIAGRAFTQEDDVPNARRVVVVGHGLWKRRFGGDVSAVGRTIRLGGEPHEIVGVLPEGFRPIVAGAAEIWRPLRINTASPARGAVVLRAIARLPDGVTIERAQAGASALAKRLEAAYPEFNEKTDFNLTPLHDRVVGDIKPGLMAVFGAVGFVLLIACANMANLLLARGSARGRELAVRVALGATRARVIRQLLTESVLLAGIGGAVGLVFGVWAVGGLVSLAPSNAPRVNEVGLDATVFAFAALLTLATGVAFGLAPALQSSRTGVADALKDAARGGSGMGGRAIRRTLVVAEIALALILLTGGALLLETFVRLQSADLGFNPENVLVGSVNPPRVSYDTPPKLRALYDQVLEKAAALPGVQKAALASVLPLSGDSDTSFSIEGRPAPATQSETPITWYRQVSAGYFDAMGMTIRRGRAFAAGEPAPSVVVNETFVRTFFPREEPLGRRVRFSEAPADPVVHDHRRRGRREGPRRPRGGEGGDLHSVLAPHRARHRRDSEEREPCPARGAAEGGGVVGGSQHPGFRHHDAVGDGRRFDRAAEIRRDAGRRLRRAGVGPGGDRPLRCDGVCRLAADDGDWRQDGAWRNARRGVSAGNQGRPAARCARHRARRRRIAPRGAVAHRVALRRAAGQSHDARPDRSRAAIRVGVRQLRPGAPRDACGSDGRDSIALGACLRKACTLL